MPRHLCVVPELRHVIGSGRTCGLVAWLFADAVTMTAGHGGAVSFKTRPMIMLEVERGRVVVYVK